MDSAHKWTDRRLAAMEKRLAAIYGRANEEVTEKINEYLKNFLALDKAKRESVLSGKITEEEYKRWKRTQVFIGKNWRNTRDEISKAYLDVNKTALAYINGELPEVYARNYNAFAGTANVAAKEYGVEDYSFTLTDADTVKKLATENKTLLPYKEVDGKLDVRWNTKKLNAEVLQSILQGESVGKLAARLEAVTEMNHASAVRNARTMVTSAECAGRQASYVRAEADGMIIEREWIATNDGRTRHAHRLLDGQTAAVNKPFKAEGREIMYPGDPTAHPSLVYNCRCTIAANVKGFRKISGTKRVGQVDFKNEQAVLRTLRAGELASQNIAYEVAYTVTSDGSVWKSNGMSGFVAVSDIPESLKGSYSYHNHPSQATWYSFSAEDVGHFIESGEKYAKASDDVFEYVMKRTAETVDLDYGTVYNRFKNINKTDVLVMACNGELDMDIDGYHETMKKLSEEYNFYYERSAKNGDK